MISFLHPKQELLIKSYEISPADEDIQNCKDFYFRHNCTENKIIAAVPLNATSIIIASQHAGILQTMVRNNLNYLAGELDL